MPIWVLNLIYYRVQDRVIIGCSYWNSIFVLQTFENASKLWAFAISGQSHFHIQVCIVKDIRCVVLIISLRDFIIIVDAFKFFVEISVVINKVLPMVRVGLIPNISILTAAFHFLLHSLIKILKRIFYIISHLLNAGESLND